MVGDVKNNKALGELGNINCVKHRKNSIIEI